MIGKRVCVVFLSATLAVGLVACPNTGDDSGAVCGNGLQETGESCDDGNNVDGDGCSADCKLEYFCGNGIKEPGEECDDGNYNQGDGCSPDCAVEQGCGDGVLDVGEQCDDDNVMSGDGCSSTCQDEDGTATCGNGIWELGEGCDDGNTDDGDGCSASCVREDNCGNGQMDPGEQCDDGNNVSGDGCKYDCRREFVCGDDICDEANHESCEFCPHDCCPDCGNGALDSGEECDDHNNEAGDGCSPGCKDEDGVATCGNGIWEAGEGCDDGNTDPDDGCDASCEPEYVCGDGQCDTAHHETCVVCQQDCCPNCGTNGRIDQGEQCDGTEFGGLTCEDFCYGGGTLSCTSNCQIDTSTCTGDLPVCGDGTAGCNEECDLTDLRSMTCESLGFSSGSLSCAADCTFDVAGCTDRLWYLQEGFEGGQVPFGWKAHGIWEVGTPSTVGPATAHGGSDCAGTRIAGNYGDGATYTVDYLESPRVDLSGATSPQLRFYRWLESQADYDGGNLWISEDGGLSFSLVPDALLDPPYDHDPVVAQPAWTGAFGSRGWQPVYVDLSSYAGRSVVLRWAFASDLMDNDHPGMYVDDVLLTEGADLPVEVTSASPLPTAVVNYPYSVPIVAQGGTGTYQFSIVDGTNIDWLTLDSATGVLSGTPDASDVGPVTISVRVEESTNSANFVEVALGLEVLNGLYFEDFEGGQPSGWDYGISILGPVWEWGTATSGPGSCHSGTGCVATVVGGDYNPQATMTAATVTSTQIDLSSATAPVLTYWQWIQFGATDGGKVQVVVGGVPQDVTGIDPPYNGTMPSFGVPGGPGYQGDLSAWGWHQVTLDLSAYAGQTIQIAWTMQSDFMATTGAPGWYIDDILIAD